MAEAVVGALKPNNVVENIASAVTSPGKIADIKYIRQLKELHSLCEALSPSVYAE